MLRATGVAQLQCDFVAAHGLLPAGSAIGFHCSRAARRAREAARISVLSGAGHVVWPSMTIARPLSERGFRHPLAQDQALRI